MGLSESRPDRHPTVPLQVATPHPFRASHVASDDRLIPRDFARIAAENFQEIVDLIQK